jgi:hypothetical protein
MASVTWKIANFVRRRGLLFLIGARFRYNCDQSPLILTDKTDGFAHVLDFRTPLEA